MPECKSQKKSIFFLAKEECFIASNIRVSHNSKKSRYHNFTTSDNFILEIAVYNLSAKSTICKLGNARMF